MNIKSLLISIILVFVVLFTTDFLICGLFMALYGQTHTLISYAVQPFSLEIV